MAAPVERSRTGCALHGALYAAAAVNGVVPVVHSNPGCGFQAYQFGLAAGWNSPPVAGGTALPCSSISEKQIVFGGTSRLREQLKNAVKVMDGQLYVVLSGCATEMVGDDVPAMVKESRDQGVAAIDIATAGFRGSAYSGYELFLRGILARHDVVTSGEAGPRPGLVNILGIVPQQDPFWEGELEELARLVASIGLRANTVFGVSGGMDGLQHLAAAELSIVVSPWGRETARELERRFGIPWLETAGLPVGAEASADLLRRLAEKLKRDIAAVEAVLAEEIRRERHYFGKLAEAYYRHALQREFALVATSAHAIGVARFLSGALGLVPGLIVVTDNPPPAARAAVEALLAKLATTFGAEILFSEDTAEIREAIVRRGPEIVLGSALEREAAQGLGVPLAEVSFPVTDRVALDRGLAGTRGALTLIDEVSRAVLSQH